jgi:excisionase family DNA binding protein
MTCQNIIDHSEEKVLLVKEVAARLRCGLSTVYDMVDRGDLAAFRLGTGKRSGLRILASSVDGLVQWASAPPPPAAPAPAAAPAKKGRPGRKAVKCRRVEDVLLLG